MKKLVLGMALLLGVSGASHASTILMLFDFPGGFSASYNGGANAPSGPLSFALTVESTTPDLDASAIRGRFALSSIELTAPSLGIADEPVVSPSPLYVDTFINGMTIIGAGFDPDIGWNGGPAPSSFMSDVNDLSTLPLPFSTATNSTFFLQTITLQNGDTLGASTGGGGPDGRFSARAASSVPDGGSTLLLLGLSIFGMGYVRWRARRA